MDYCKKTAVFLKNEGLKGACDKLGGRLEEAGIGYRYCPAADRRALPREEGLLWLTDDAAFAGRLAGEGQAVLFCVDPARTAQEPPGFDGVRYACERPEELEPAFVENVYRRYRRIPWDICETKRCRIRETTEADVEDFYEIYGEPSVTRYMENLYDDPEREREYIREYADRVYALYEFGIWTVVHKESGRIIGRAGFDYREGFEEPELGFVIGVPWQRQGYAFEVCQAVLDYGRETLGFDRVQAFVEPENQVSVRLCERLGFTRLEELTVDSKRYIRFRNPMQLYVAEQTADEYNRTIYDHIARQTERK